jgi:hypothetical protein
VISVRQVLKVSKVFKESQVRLALLVLRERMVRRDQQVPLVPRVLLGLWARLVLRERLVLLVQQFFGTF